MQHGGRPPARLSVCLGAAPPGPAEGVVARRHGPRQPRLLTRFRTGAGLKSRSLAFPVPSEGRLLALFWASGPGRRAEDAKAMVPGVLPLFTRHTVTLRAEPDSARLTNHPLSEPCSPLRAWTLGSPTRSHHAWAALGASESAPTATALPSCPSPRAELSSLAVPEGPPQSPSSPSPLGSFQRCRAIKKRRPLCILQLLGRPGWERGPGIGPPPSAGAGRDRDAHSDRPGSARGEGPARDAARAPALTLPLASSSMM